jgi:hypothetical protein
VRPTNSAGTLGGSGTRWMVPLGRSSIARPRSPYPSHSMNQASSVVVVNGRSNETSANASVGPEDRGHAGPVVRRDRSRRCAGTPGRLDRGLPNRQQFDQPHKGLCLGWGNYSGFCSESLNAMFEDALRLQETNPAATNSAWIDLDHQVVEEAIVAPWITRSPRSSSRDAREASRSTLNGGFCSAAYGSSSRSREVEYRACSFITGSWSHERIGAAMPDIDCFVEVVGPRGMLSDSVDIVLEKGPSTVGIVCRQLLWS